MGKEIPKRQMLKGKEIEVSKEGKKEKPYLVYIESTKTS